MTSRKYFIDFLRIVAIFAVIMIHVTYSGTYVNPDDSFSVWSLHMLLDGLSQSAVPIFVMISGYLYLSKPDFSAKQCVLKVIRLLSIYFIVSFLYAIYENVIFPSIHLSEIDHTIRSNIIIHTFRGGEYHLWFLPMLCGLYILTPFIREIIKNCNHKYIYFIIFLYIFMNAVNMFAPLHPDTITSSILGFVNAFYLPYSNFAIYYIGGYFLGTLSIDKTKRIILYLCNIIGIVIMLVLTLLISKKQLPESNFSFMNTTSFFTIINSASIFIFFRYLTTRFHIGNLVGKIIIFLSRSTLPIYLVHVYFIRELDRMQIFTYYKDESVITSWVTSFSLIANNYIKVLFSSFVLGAAIIVICDLIRYISIRAIRFIQLKRLSKNIINSTQQYL